jgi:hypothetical protein
VNAKSMDNAEVNVTNNEKIEVSTTAAQISSSVTVPDCSVCTVASESSAVSPVSKSTTTKTDCVIMDSSAASKGASPAIGETGSKTCVNALGIVCADIGAAESVADRISSVELNESRANVARPPNKLTENSVAQLTHICDSSLETRTNNVLTVTTQCAGAVSSSDSLLSVSSNLKVLEPTCTSTPQSHHRPHHKSGGTCRHAKGNSEYPTAEIVYV